MGQIVSCFALIAGQLGVTEGRLMKLSDRQFQFAKDVILLMTFCAVNNVKITLGEAFRTEYQHKEYQRIEYTFATRSKHQDRLAIDLNMWSGDKVMWTMTPAEQKAAFQHVGDYWESIRPGNKWGGNWHWIDATHFEAS